MTLPGVYLSGRSIDCRSIGLQFESGCTMLKVVVFLKNYQTMLVPLLTFV